MHHTLCANCVQVSPRCLILFGLATPWSIFLLVMDHLWMRTRGNTWCFLCLGLKLTHIICGINPSNDRVWSIHCLQKLLLPIICLMQPHTGTIGIRRKNLSHVFFAESFPRMLRIYLRLLWSSQWSKSAHSKATCKVLFTMAFPGTITAHWPVNPQPEDAE